VRKTLRRAQVLPLFEKLVPCLVGIEESGWGSPSDTGSAVYPIAAGSPADKNNDAWARFFIQGRSSPTTLAICSKSCPPGRSPTAPLLAVRPGGTPDGREIRFCGRALIGRRDGLV
jgi:hypothetical protein